MPNTALVTGASSGIGRELARIHASKGGDLVVTARREDALNELKSELEARHGSTVHVIPSDLGTLKGVDSLCRDIKKKGISIDVLINNAGFGGFGKHVERDLRAEMSMIDLNVKALVSLTHRLAGDMIARGGGKILNVGSTAGFVPGPNQAVYFATKAFVNSFSQAIDQEMRGKGVTCTVLVPGYVETEFAERGDLEGTEMAKAGGATPESVAQTGYEAMQRGDLVAFNDWKFSLMLNWLVPFLPRRMALRMIEKNQSKS